MLRIVLYLTLFCFFFQLHANEKGFFTQAEMLYYQAEETGLCYAIEGSKAKNFTFEWDVGFNIGIGYRVPHDRWQLLLQFTSLQTHCDALKKDNLFFPVWLSSPALANRVKAHWRLHFGMIDFLLSKSYNATPTLTLIPQIGVRFGSARQKFNLEYSGEDLPFTTVRMKNKFAGLGPWIGLTTEYALPLGFSLFAKGAISALYGEFYLHQDEDAEEKLLGFHSIFRATSPFLEATAGIQWHHRRLTLGLAWDQLILFSQNQFARFCSQPGITLANQGDLSLAGARFHIALDF